MTQRIFDGHNDVLSSLARKGDTTGEGFFLGDSLRHLDLYRAKEGGFTGGFFAIWVPEPGAGLPSDDKDDGEIGNEPDIEAIPHAHARSATFRQAELANKMATQEGLRLCLTADAIETAEKEGDIACFLHLEGAEGIGPDLTELDDLYEMGLRSLGPVWSRPNAFAHGVPFRYGRSPDTGPGLTDDGIRLIKRCAEIGLIIDLSHINEAGFWDIARLYDGPLVATHSNVHAICPATRNLTDKQLSAMAERGGIAGLNFNAAFLREDGRRNSDVPLETMIRHLDALINALGEDGVALGSDFDGALMPKTLGDCEGLPRLVAEMERADFGAVLIEKICWSNWLALIRGVVG